MIYKLINLRSNMTSVYFQGHPAIKYSISKNKSLLFSISHKNQWYNILLYPMVDKEFGHFKLIDHRSTFKFQKNNRISTIKELNRYNFFLGYSLFFYYFRTPMWVFKENKWITLKYSKLQDILYYSSWCI